MAEEQHLERTEQASPRRLEQAREEGQVARSTELSTFAIVSAGAVALWLYGGVLAGELQSVTRATFAFDRQAAVDVGVMLNMLHEGSTAAALAFLPFGLTMLLAALAAPLLLGGWVFSARVLAPDPARLNPLSGIRRMFSLTSLVTLLRSVAKALLLTVAAAWAGWLLRDQVIALIQLAPVAALPRAASLAGLAAFAMVGAMLLVAALDVPYQVWSYHRKLRMTRDEARRELKESEGDPQLKARVRSLQRETARRRMMAQVPQADVVVTNPSHYAVALRYREADMRAPRVVAKGAHLLAGRIRELAQEHGVPILEAPPLARALYRHAELDREIPVVLYTAVAEVLAYVHQLRRSIADGRPLPQAPGSIAVPDGLDPGVNA